MIKNHKDAHTSVTSVRSGRAEAQSWFIRDLLRVYNSVFHLKVAGTSGSLTFNLWVVKMGEVSTQRKPNNGTNGTGEVLELSNSVQRIKQQYQGTVPSRQFYYKIPHKLLWFTAVQIRILRFDFFTEDFWHFYTLIIPSIFTVDYC